MCLRLLLLTAAGAAAACHAVCLGTALAACLSWQQQAARLLLVLLQLHGLFLHYLSMCLVLLVLHGGGPHQWQSGACLVLLVQWAAAAAAVAAAAGSASAGA
jgi:hypothetical protein